MASVGLDFTLCSLFRPFLRVFFFACFFEQVSLEMNFENRLHMIVIFIDIEVSLKI